MKNSRALLLAAAFGTAVFLTALKDNIAEKPIHEKPAMTGCSERLPDNIQKEAIKNRTAIYRLFTSAAYFSIGNTYQTLGLRGGLLIVGYHYDSLAASV